MVDEEWADDIREAKIVEPGLIKHFLGDIS